MDFFLLNFVKNKRKYKDFLRCNRINYLFTRTFAV